MHDDVSSYALFPNSEPYSSMLCKKINFAAQTWLFRR